ASASQATGPIGLDLLLDANPWLMPSQTFGLVAPPNNWLRPFQAAGLGSPMPRRGLVVSWYEVDYFLRWGRTAPPGLLDRVLTVHIYRVGRRQARQVAISGQTGRLVSLTVHGPLGPRGTGDLVASPELRNLVALGLPGCQLDDRAAEALASSPHL